MHKTSFLDALRSLSLTLPFLSCPIPDSELMSDPRCRILCYEPRTADSYPLQRAALGEAAFWMAYILIDVIKRAVALGVVVDLDIVVVAIDDVGVGIGAVIAFDILALQRYCVYFL